MFHNILRKQQQQNIQIHMLKMESKHITPIKIIIILIPIIIVIYILNMNFLFSQEFNHYYDIGGEENYLSPSNRISEKYDSQRNLTGNLVYFGIEVPRGSKEIKIETKFKSNFPEGESLKLGAKDQQEWHYNWHTIYTQKEENNDWEIITTTFNIEEENLVIEKNQLSLIFWIEHLYGEEYKNYTIPIDYINITIYKPGLL
jgi:hypothetical protein